MMEIRALEQRDQQAIERFLERIPERDRTFFKEDVDDAEVRAAWARPGTRDVRLLAVDGGTVLGYGALVPLQAWSSHVGEVRVIVDPAHRGRGIGRSLARAIVLAAVSLDLTKMVVEVVADEESTIGMFRSHGFEPEALLKDHVRDQSGELRDLMILAHSVEESYASLTATGIAESV
jgi:L-amino acid N-acyltransferase YncA